MKKQTSVDWLAEEHEKLMNKYVHVMLIKDSRYHDLKSKLLQTARQMHREEVEEAYEAAFYDSEEDGFSFNTNYYAQTFETP